MNNRTRNCGLAALLVVTVLVAPTRAASHREAPLMALDPAADISDVYAFVGYDAENLARSPGSRRVTLIMNVFPGQEPGSGPNYFAFDDLVLYQIGVDNDRDGEAEDVVYQVRFKTEVQTPEQFLATLGGIEPFLPAVTAPDGPGAAGLARIQRYTVTELRGCTRSTDGFHDCARRTRLFDGSLLPTVPSNIGPRTMPNYDSLSAQGIFTDPETGIRVFAGQRAETFAIDLGAVFDTVNLRVEAATPIPNARPPLPIQTAAEDADDTANPFGVNNFSGFNVNTIAIEIPPERLTVDRRPPTAHTSTIGVSATTLRQQETERRGEPAIRAANGPPKFLIRGDDDFVQVSRMGNPLVNELLIPIGLKDFWNAVDPDDEYLFLRSYRTPSVAAALELVSGVPVPATPREDLVLLLLKYAGQDPDADEGPFSDLLRLDMTVPPTPPSEIKRLGPFAHDAGGNATPDPAGFPNGRRPNDDVTDIVVRAAGGQNYIDNYVGDGVGIAEKGVTTEFPFLPAPFDGRDRRHRDPGEM